ncbi:MAG: hypothetical protein IJX55_08545 [Clostridia bacterium]|nr:hypothetical protein [Clostridia bacterium]
MYDDNCGVGNIVYFSPARMTSVYDERVDDVSFTYMFLYKRVALLALGTVMNRG